jgi:hypothetical protein
MPQNGPPGETFLKLGLCEARSCVRLCRPTQLQPTSSPVWSTPAIRDNSDTHISVLLRCSKTSSWRLCVQSERVCELQACEFAQSEFSCTWAGASPRVRSIKAPWGLAAVAPSRSHLRRSQWRPRRRAKAVGTLATAEISLGGGRSSTLPTGNHGTAPVLVPQLACCSTQPL